MCGKDCANPSLSLTAMGSPPHVRERPDAMQEDARNTRITPACAGKTTDFDVIDTANEDHPRMCGKDYFCLVQLIMGLGSPPHVRERQTQKQLKLLNNRITPACAGKTVTKATHSLGNGDHPRMCGKDTRNMLNPALASGSPPHVRERP